MPYIHIPPFKLSGWTICSHLLDALYTGDWAVGNKAGGGGGKCEL